MKYKPEHKFDRPLSVWLFTIVLMTTMISFLYSMVVLC
jgi:hypothetical protein